jgi:hemerythrin
MMKKSGYADYDTHHALHVDFVKKLKALKTPLGTDDIKFAKEW